MDSADSLCPMELLQPASTDTVPITCTIDITDTNETPAAPGGNPFRHVDLLPMTPSRMYYNPELCIPAVVDNEWNGYNICPVWNERGFLSDCDPMYDDNKKGGWSSPISQGVNVTVIPFKDTDIAWNELTEDENEIPNTFLLNHKNRILEFIHNERERAFIIRQFNGQSFKAKSLKLIRSRKELRPLLTEIQKADANVRLIAIFVDFKWNHDTYVLSIKPRRHNRPHERSVTLCLFVYNGAVMNVCDGLMLKSCLVMKRNDWIHGMYDKPPYHQIESHILHLNQFWLHCLSVDIAPYWGGRYCDNRALELSSLIIPTRFIPYFYQKRFRMYSSDDSMEFRFWYHRKHFLLRCDLHPPECVIDSEDDEEEEPEDALADLTDAWKLFGDNINMEHSEFIDAGIECHDGIFSPQSIERIMRKIKVHLKSSREPHFALEYGLHRSEKEVITELYPDVMLSGYSNYQHKPETYQMYKGSEWWPSDEEEEYETEGAMEKKSIYFGYYNFIPGERTAHHKNNNNAQQDSDVSADDSKIDQIYHQHGAIPIPEHFQSSVHMIHPTSESDHHSNEDPSRGHRTNRRARYGTKQYHEQTLERHVYKYNKVKRKIRERELIKKAMSDLNAAHLRCYMHANYNKVNINLSNQLPAFWSEEIKPQLLKYKLEKIAKYYQFAFVYSCAADCNHLSIPVYEFKCDDGEILHFQNVEMSLMVFCRESVTMYFDDISLIAIPGRIYSFLSDTIGCDHIKIFNQKDATIDVVVLRHTPCHVGISEQADLDDETYGSLYFDINSYVENREVIQIGGDGEFHSVTADDDGLPILGAIYPTAKQPHMYDDDDSAGSDSNSENSISTYTDAGSEWMSETESDDMDTDSERETGGAIPELISLTLISQKVLRLDAEEKSINSAVQLNAQKELINAAFDRYTEVTEQRKYFKRLLRKNEIPEYSDDIMFYIANSYEQQRNYTKSLHYLTKSLLENEKRNRKYYKALTLYHKYICVNNTQGIEAMDPELLGLMEEAWKNTAVKEDKYRAIRDEWRSSGEEKEELIGAARCALSLASYYEDKCVLDGKCKWNDMSLIWYKRALNILERANMIVIEVVSNHEVVSMHKARISVVLDHKDNNESGVSRKRVRVLPYSNGQFLKTVEDALQRYMQCMVERLRGEEYTNNEEEMKISMEHEACFVDFDGCGSGADFDAFLHYELDSVFEMNHFYFQHEIAKKTNTPIMIADLYINYAVYLQEVCRHYESALVLYQYSLQHNKDATTCWNMAEIYEEMRRYDEAIKYLDLVIEYTPIESDEYQKNVCEVNQRKEEIQQSQIHQIVD